MNYYFPTVFDAIREAGGITRYSDLKNIELIRINTISEGGSKKKTSLNFADMIYNGSLSQNIRIFNGDIIKVAKLNKPNTQNLSTAITSRLNSKFIKVYVSGRVKKGGEIEIPRSASLNDAISVSGGLNAVKGKISFVRFEKNGNISRDNIKFSPTSKPGSKKNPYLLNGDIIYVQDNFLSRTTEILQEITAPFSSAFSAYGLYKAIND